jgi:glycerate kinase
MAIFPTPKTRDELDARIAEWIGTQAYTKEKTPLVEYLAAHGVYLIPEEATEDQYAHSRGGFGMAEAALDEALVAIIDGTPYCSTMHRCKTPQRGA